MLAAYALAAALLLNASAEKPAYMAGQNVKLRAEVRNNGSQPARAVPIEAVIRHAGGKEVARKTFAQKPARFSVPLSRITGEDWVYEAGDLDRRVVPRRVAEQYGRDARFRWADKQVPSGTTAYWVRVLQQDGAIAWSTPIFVTRRQPVH